MKREYYQSSASIKEGDEIPGINDEALNFKIEEIDVERKFVFHIGDESLSIFKFAQEPYIHTFLKACAYYIYKPLYNTLSIDPPLYRKYKADLLALDYTNEPKCWIECFERDFEKIEYICKHMHIDELILVELSEDINNYLEMIKKKVHYKYHHLITVINFVPEIIHYVDPNDIYISEDWYHLTDLV